MLFVFECLSIFESMSSRRASPASSRGNSPQRNANFKSESPKRGRGSPASLRKFNRSPSIRDSSPMSSIRTSISRGSESDLNIGRMALDDENMKNILSYNQGEDNINVVVRVRPLNEKEKRGNDGYAVEFPGNGQIMIRDVKVKTETKPKMFSFNAVFEPAATQEDILQFSGMKKLIEMSVEGFRCTCFCYGQTGSGKTHTLTGPPGLFGLRTSAYSDEHGLIFRSFLYLFQLIREKPDVHFILKASFLEIYNEKVIDLLNPGTARKPLAVRWSKKARGFFVENLFMVDCEELDDLIAVLEEGMRNRAVGRHNMNDFSSRSHTILTVRISSEQPAENHVFLSRSGKMNFVDLAGSEMTKKTGSKGKTLEEANNINKSLMVLGYCISSLSDPKRKHSHIPYRDSKLTKLLADSLAGNGVTLMVACVSPSRSNLNETINTLRYAARAKRIRTKPVVLMDPREALILSLKHEIDVLQSENEHLRSALKTYYSGSNTAATGDGRGGGVAFGDAVHVPTTLIQTGVNPSPMVMEKLSELENSELIELIKLYMTENEALRKERGELFTSREMLQRDHEIVCRENERLLKKVEDKTCTPILYTRPAFSAEYLNVSHEQDSSRKKSSDERERSVNTLPTSIQRELKRRQFGKELHIHRKLGDNNNQKKSRMKKAEHLNMNSLNNGTNGVDTTQRRFSIAQVKNSDSMNGTTENSDVFGSVISLNSEIND